MSVVSSIRLFEAEPDLLRFVSAADATAAQQTRLPVVELQVGEITVHEVLEADRAFAAILIEGTLLQSMRLGEHAGLRLLGPGDVISLTLAESSMLALDSGCRVTAPTRIALFGRELLIAARRWPWLVAGLHVHSAQQSERLLTQLMICQLPRVDDRLLAMLWLLSESWGHVTTSGTVLPIELTHSALGGLVGARRPTVTLALSDLTERGAVVRQSDGWLLLERPKSRARAESEAVGEPRLLNPAASPWGAAIQSTRDYSAIDELTVQEMKETVSRLRAEHAVRKREMSERLGQLVAKREEITRMRQKIERGRARRQAPS